MARGEVRPTTVDTAATNALAAAFRKRRGGPAELERRAEAEYREAYFCCPDRVKAAKRKWGAALEDAFDAQTLENAASASSAVQIVNTSTISASRLSTRGASVVIAVAASAIALWAAVSSFFIPNHFRPPTKARRPSSRAVQSRAGQDKTGR